MDIVQLLVESIALNSTANIYTDKDGAACFCLLYLYLIWMLT